MAMSIVSQVQSQTVRDGAVLQLFVIVAGGSGVYTYQWKKNAVNVAHATNSVYVIDNFMASDAGTYVVDINDGVNTISSSAIVLGLAPVFMSEQSKLIKYDNLSTSVRRSEVTIPMTDAQNLKMINLTTQRRDNLRADVEEPQLEAEKKVSGSAVDAHGLADPVSTHGVNYGNHYNPHHVNPLPTFRQDIRINMRYVHPSSSRLVNPSDYAEKVHYVYNKDYGSFQKRYYDDNPWKDAKGRVHLFERPFTRNFA